MRYIFLLSVLFCGVAAAAPQKMNLEQISTLAKQGDNDAQARLGEAYLNGNYGLTVDYSEALKWSLQAVEKGSFRAKLNLAILYLNGLGTAFDYDKARELLLEAEQGGQAKAARYLGMIYERGLGVPQDYRKAAEYYQKSDQNGDITGQYRLAKLYEQGLGVERNYQNAISLYLKHQSRIDHITAPSFQALSEIYALGLGMAKNPLEAEKWLKLAEQAKAVK